MAKIKTNNSKIKKNKGGRPKEWTEDRISDLAIKLLDWAAKPDSYALIQFCNAQNICASKLSNLAKENEEFREALSRAKTRIAARMIENINSRDGNCHPIFFSRYIRANDYFLDQFMKEQEKVECSDIGKHVIKIIDFSKMKNIDQNVEQEYGCEAFKS